MKLFRRVPQSYPHRQHTRFVSPAGGDPRVVDYQPRDLTQEEQDQEDEKSRREAMRDLVESWMDRLQLISVITTFFASTEASMITITAPSDDGTPMSITAQVANIGIMGALVVHSNAAIISFLAAFLLVKYKVKVATHEERQVERHIHDVKREVNPPTSKSFDGMDRTERAAHDILSMAAAGVDINHDTDPIPGRIRILSRHDPNKSVYSNNPHIVQVGLFDSYPPTHLINRCHNFCIFLTVLGFVLVLTGMICFAWDRLPPSVGISSSFFMALCLIAGLYVVLKPETKGRDSHIYCER